MKNLVLTRTLLVLVALYALAGCKLVIMVDSSGRVDSGASQGCTGPAVCEIEIVDADGTYTYEALPNHGYAFVRWQDGTGFLCAGSTNPICQIRMDDIPHAEAVVASRTSARLSPVFAETDIDTDGDGTPDAQDNDDDNDGIDDDLDSCPLDAPADLPNGCPDGDGDGVADKDDQCPLLGGNVVDIFGCPGAPIAAEDIVEVDGLEWAQPDLFLDVTWNQVDTTCPNASCPPNTVINGHQVGGWSWASADDVNALINYNQGSNILGPGPDSFDHVPGTDLALPAMIAEGFRPTSISQGYLLALTSSSNSFTRCYSGNLYPQSFSIKRYQTNRTIDKDQDSFVTGIWLYR